jgi:hypothetical protein
LFRQFGTVEAAENIGFVQDFRPSNVIDTCCSLWDNGIHVFTQAYQPMSIYRNSEIKAWREKKRDIASHVYALICLRLKGVWDIREELARIAHETRSWEAVVKRLSRVSWFGGTGFMAKECVQDMLHTVVFQRPYSEETSKLSHCYHNVRHMLPFNIPWCSCIISAQ